MKQLILGGARSGKSRYAEQQVLAQAGASGLAPRYVATACQAASDEEMRARIQRHQADRSSLWQSFEEPLHLSALIGQWRSNEAPVLIDCLTLWLSNCLLADCWPRERALFIEAFKAHAGPLTLVGNEVGLGVVPMGELSRRFVDESGFLHQTLAEHCDRVVFCAAGLPLVMKDAKA